MSDKTAEDLIEETKESFEEKKERQSDLKEAIADEHAGEVIKTTTTLAGDTTVTIHTRMEGQVMERLADVESEVEAWKSDDPSFRGASQVADDCSQVLADVIADDEMTKEFFYDVYLDTNLKALGELVTNVFEAIEAEQERMAGAVDGFRSE